MFFLIITTVKWKKQKRYKVPLILSVIFGVFALFIFNIDITSAEATDRQDSIPAFESNFGFEPPQSVLEIKHKNWGLYDSQVHWMTFTYDSKVLNKIIDHDKPLNIAENNSSEYQNIIEELKNDAHHPKWFKVPVNNTDRIYYKKDFLDHTFSEYYLWVDKDSKMTFLYVHYFD